LSTGIKIYAEVAGFARGVFKIYPEISAAMHIATYAAACRFSSVGLEILNLAAARIYPGV
jgi:hypothetical protein